MLSAELMKNFNGPEILTGRAVAETIGKKGILVQTAKERISNGMGSTTVSRADASKGYNQIFNGNGLKAYGVAFNFITEKELYNYMKTNKHRWNEPISIVDFKFDLKLFKMQKK